MGLVFADRTTGLFSLIVLIFTLTYFYVKWLYQYWQRRGVPSISPVFPVGNLGPVFRQKYSFGQHLTNLYNSSTEPLLGIYSGFVPTIMLRDPKLVQQVLIKDFNYFYDRGIFVDEINNPLTGHLFSLEGEKWKNLRAKMTPTFSSGKLRAMFPILLNCGEPLIKYVDKIAEVEKSIEIRELLAQYTTNIIASVAFGIEIDCIGDPDNDFRKYGRMVFEASARNGILAAMSFMFPKVLQLLKLKTIHPDIERFMISVVTQNLHYRETNNVSRKDFFQLLVQLRNSGTVAVDDDVWETKILDNERDKKMTINEVTAQAFIFFVAGFETSSSTMAFCLYELAKNPECMRRAQHEIDEMLNNYDGNITLDGLNELKYLERCIDGWSL